MALSFKSIGHFFATVAQKVLAVGVKIESSEQTVETVTAQVPVYGPLAVPVEKAAYAVLGEVMAVLAAGDAAAKQKLADAGLDINVIDTAEAVLKGIGGLAAIVTKL